MSITPMWRVDRDGSMFTDKKAAEEHDRMLELADGITGLLESHFEIDEKLAEEIGLLMSRNKDVMARAFKGKPDALEEIQRNEEVEADNTVDIREAVA
ncbi:YebG family protein [Endozoicomonas ascidiicola]|uniref:YebG family protein n=1 Tax=Endozoicomonas ascidiicola TaxID=1698521 RepID=UPI00082EDAB5|nr:YebG family protein [Endozoicomonas ascidiicola]